MNPAIIPIAPDAAGHAIESAMRITLTQRELLKGTGALTDMLAIFAQRHVWALELLGLDTHQGPARVQPPALPSSHARQRCLRARRQGS